MTNDNDLEARVKELESVVNEHHHYFLAAAEEHENTRIVNTSAPSPKVGERDMNEVQRSADEEHAAAKKAAKEKVEQNAKDRQRFQEEERAKIRRGQDAAAKAKEALMAGKPLLDEPLE
jgi:hypothetical protein